MVKIVIDAGHGGHDPGAVGFGMREKDLALVNALKIQAILTSEYIGATLTDGDVLGLAVKYTVAVNK